MSGEAPNKGGRPTKYTSAIADEICERIANGETLRAIEALSHMPTKTTILKWRLDDHSGFSDRYARARESSAHTMENRALDYCDRLESAKSLTEVQGLKESAQILRWAAGLRAPKTHGDLQKHEHSGSGGAPLTVTINRPEGTE